MIAQKDLESVKQAFESFESEREGIILASREILRLSKKAIYSIHRGNIKDAEALIHDAGEKLRSLAGSIKNDKLKAFSFLSSAMQEYAEALTYLIFSKEGRIMPFSEINVPIEDYLLGLCDLTGELGRRAVALAIKRDKQAVKHIMEAVDAIYALFLELDLRNSELRRKSDSIKWNLKKIEEIAYNLEANS